MRADFDEAMAAWEVDLPDDVRRDIRLNYLRIPAISAVLRRCACAHFGPSEAVNEIRKIVAEDWRTPQDEAPGRDE